MNYTSFIAHTHRSGETTLSYVVTAHKLRAQRIANRRHMKTLKTFILIVIIYFVSYIPLWFIAAQASFDYSFIYLSYCNYIGNVVVYVLVDSRFRQAMKNIFSVK